MWVAVAFALGIGLGSPEARSLEPAAVASPQSPPVHASLRAVDGRTSFLSGEPIRLELVLTADAPGYVSVVTDCRDDRVAITPDVGVAVMPKPARMCDVAIESALSASPSARRVVLNDWFRFDRAGDYAVRLTTDVRTKSVAGYNPKYGPPQAVMTDTLMLHIDLPSRDDEQRMIDRAAAALGALRGFDVQQEVAAAERLMYLGGDEAAMEKYRWWSGLPPQFANARVLLERGFGVSRHPDVILAAMERDLLDPSRVPSGGLLNSATSLKRWITHAPDEPAGLFMPMAQDPIREKYLAALDETLPMRAPANRLATAVEMILGASGPALPQARAIVVEGFGALSADVQRWLVTARWRDVRDRAIAPDLLRLIEATRTSERGELLEALADIAPEMAATPVAAYLLDPSVGVSSNLSAALSQQPPAIVQPLIDVITRMIASADPSAQSRIGGKVDALARIAREPDTAAMRQLAVDHGAALGAYARGCLYNFLLRHDAAGTVALLRREIARHPGDDFVSNLSAAPDSAAAPALATIARDLLSSARSSASLVQGTRLLARVGTAEDLGLIQARLAAWRAAHRAEAAAETLSPEERWIERDLVTAIRDAPAWIMTPADIARLRDGCITQAARDALPRLAWNHG